MTPTITAFEQSPDRGRGLARDMPVRWALEEVGQPYDVRLVSFAAMKRAITWMFAALATVQPPIVEREAAMLLERDKPWHAERLPILDDRIRLRLGELSERLGDADWLDDAFSAGDLLMVTVLRRLAGSGMLEDYPNLSAYVARGEARSAFKRAFEAQREVFTRTQATPG